ncbi:MAG: DUF1844 domain-containing protein [Planctomycetes bacterium]|nr:DUF1844 domain-containing protein [Planctomycetota bacterium]MCB9911011.1 DUF1844 domain-containing protein [Planctomycetota bacterium]HPF13392.1 DUF1844 domain-containing protein [Planctomycetota bacterium]HRV81845.1 DUF1844 domain-containing protein [Planctomycetota bacterium]
MTQRTASDMPLPGGDFRLFLTRLSLQGFLACGLLENPITGRKDVNPAGARMVLDDLKMLREKTLGNLEPGEEQTIDKAIEDLGHAVAALKA